MNKRNLIGVLAALISICALVAAVSFPSTRLASVPIAVAGLLLASSFFGTGGQLATQLAELKGQTVSVQVWGDAPEGAAAATFRVHSTRTFGAGLHLWLECRSGGEVRHLKVAQPKATSCEGAEFRITEAAYVQWAGRRMSRQEGADALVLRRCEAAALRK